MPLRNRQPGVVAPKGFRRPWLRSRRPVARLVARPLERFLRREAGSGAALLVAAGVALLWANLAHASYAGFWTTEVVVRVGSSEIALSAGEVVNDLLMVVFFHVVALEVKRELLHGALRDRRSAALPVAAAIGSMVGAALVYLAVNANGGDLRGWAIPIATDIAFAMAAIGLVGRRAPTELRPFFLTLAVIDDFATIVLVALVFSAGLSASWLSVAALALVAVIALQRLEVRLLAPYVVVAAALWLALYEGGVHPTLAGVLLGFLTPARPFYPPRRPDARSLSSWPRSTALTMRSSARARCGRSGGSRARPSRRWRGWKTSSTRGARISCCRSSRSPMPASSCRLTASRPR